MDATEKVREARARRMARRQGYELIKSRRRDPNALDYGRFWIVAEMPGGGRAWRSRILIAGEQAGLTLNQVESWLESDWPEQFGLSVDSTGAIVLTEQEMAELDRRAAEPLDARARAWLAEYGRGAA
jgi:hypothetical protein